MSLPQEVKQYYTPPTQYAPQVYGITYGTKEQPQPTTKQQEKARIFYSSIGYPEFYQKGYSAPDIPEGQEVVSVKEVVPSTPPMSVQQALTPPQPHLEFTVAPKGQTLGLAETGFVALQTAENILLAKTSQKSNQALKTFLEVGPLFQGYAVTGMISVAESNVYFVPSLLGVKTPLTGPTITGAALSAILGSPAETQAFQERPYAYQMGSVFGEAAVSILEAEAIGRATSYVFQRSGLASKTQTWINQRYIESVEETGVWQPSRTERLVMRVTGIQPRIATSIVDIPEMVMPESPSAAIKEYPDILKRTGVIDVNEPMPKDWLQGFSFESTPEEVAQLSKIKSTMPESYLEGFRYPSGLKAGVLSEPMPAGFLSSYGLSTSEMTEITKISKQITLPDIATVTRQELAWGLTESPRSSGLLVSKYLETFKPTAIARGSWSSYGLALTGSQKAVTEITKFTVPDATPPKALTVSAKETGVSTRAMFVVPNFTTQTTQKASQNPFSQFMGTPFYSSRSRASEETEMQFFTMPGQLSAPTRFNLNLPSFDVGLSAFSTSKLGVSQYPFPIQGLPTIQAQPQPQIPKLEIPEPTKPSPNIPFPNVPEVPSFDIPPFSPGSVNWGTLGFGSRSRRGRYGFFEWTFRVEQPSKAFKGLFLFQQKKRRGGKRKRRIR